MAKPVIDLLLTLFLLQCVIQIDGRKVRECGDPQWKPYKNEKCFKLLDLAMTKTDGKEACSKEIQYSFEDSLLTVKSEDEQYFITEWLFEDEHIQQNLWLAAHRTDQNDWMWDDDNSTVQYQNWERGSKPINPNKNCLQMLWEDEDDTSDNKDTLGRWQPTSCSGTKNLVVCQKPQISQQWQEMQDLIKAVKQESERTKKDLSATKERFSRAQNKSRQLETELVKTKKGLETVQLENMQAKELLKEISLENQRLNGSFEASQATLNQTRQDVLNTSQSVQFILGQNVTRREIDLIHRKAGELDLSMVGVKTTLQGMNKNLSDTRDSQGKLEVRVEILEGQMKQANIKIEDLLYNLGVPTSCDTVKPSLKSIQQQTIYPDGHKGLAVQTLCDFDTDGGNWTVIQKRSSGPKEEFYLGWADYERGFGSPDKNYWIGLRNIYALTKNRDCELRIDLWDFEGNYTYAKYSNFYVSNSSDFYRLTIGGYFGSAGDSMTGSDKNLTGMRFTTKDKKNDLWTGTNCAEEDKGAWWYHSCSCSNLNGFYYEKGETPNPRGSGMRWYSWKNSWRSLRQVEMKIRKRR